MTFGDRGGGGGFFISPGAIINAVAAAAIGGIALMVLSANSDLATLKDAVANQGYAIHRLEGSMTAVDQTITAILGNQRGLEDAKTSLQEDTKRLREEQLDLTKKLDALDFILRPPRTNNGH